LCSARVTLIEDYDRERAAGTQELATDIDKYVLIARNFDRADDVTD
jgi:hypothetical protein